MDVDDVERDVSYEVTVKYRKGYATLSLLDWPRSIHGIYATSSKVLHGYRVTICRTIVTSKEPDPVDPRNTEPTFSSTTNDGYDQKVLERR